MRLPVQRDRALRRTLASGQDWQAWLALLVVDGRRTLNMDHPLTASRVDEAHNELRRRLQTGG